MDKNWKICLATILFLLAVLCGLVLWGIWGSNFDWFTGSRLVVLFALGAMLAQVQEAKGNPNAGLMRKVFCAMAFLIGSHLLTPYFWPGRIQDINVFSVFWMTAGCAWLLLVHEAKKTNARTDEFKIFCQFPVIMFIGSMLSVYMDYGSFYAQGLVCLFYLGEGGMLVHKGILEKSRAYFNAGLLLFALLLVACSLTFLFELPTILHIAIAVLFIIFLNVIFHKII